MGHRRQAPDTIHCRHMDNELWPRRDGRDFTGRRPFPQMEHFEEQASGRNRFEGSVLTYTVDQYIPSFHPERDPAYHNQVSVPVQVGGSEMILNGEHWHRN